MKIKSTPSLPTTLTLKRKPKLPKKNDAHVVVPYTKGLSKSVKIKMCNNHGKHVHCKGSRPINGLLVAPKGRDTMRQKIAMVYKYKCAWLECDEEYTGELARTFG